MDDPFCRHAEACTASGCDRNGASLQVLDIRGVFADDHHGVVVLRETPTRTDGAKLDVNESHVLALDGEGRITELWDLPDDPEAHDRFFDGV
jgi:hypothetical protein